jgi:hypothetical protein
MGVTPPSEFVFACHLSATRWYRTPSLGFLSPFATSVRGVHWTMRIPPSSTVRPQCFSHSRRFAPPRTLRAYFIPQPRPGFALQGFSPLPSCAVSSTVRSALAVRRRTPAGELPRRCQRAVSGLQRFDPGSDPLPSTKCLALSTLDPLLRFQLPRALLRAPWECLRIPSAHDLHCERYVSVLQLASSVSIGVQPAGLSPDRPSRPSFPTFLYNRRSGCSGQVRWM